MWTLIILWIMIALNLAMAALNLVSARRWYHACKVLEAEAALLRAYTPYQPPPRLPLSYDPSIHQLKDE